MQTKLMEPMQKTKHVQQQDFSFDFPLIERGWKKGRVTTTHVGTLNISGIAYKDTRISILESGRYTADIDFVMFNGTDIKPVLFAMDKMEEIEQAAEQHAAFVFSTDQMANL